jgi:hypothetical protein
MAEYRDWAGEFIDANLDGGATAQRADRASGTSAFFHLSVFSLVVAAIVAILFIPLVVRDRVARFWGLGSMLSLLPIGAVGPENRLLGFVGLGSMALLAQLTQALFAGSFVAPVPRVWKGFARAATLLPLLLHLIAAPLLGIARIAYQVNVSSKMERAMASVPSDRQIASQDLVLINPPDHIYLVTAILSVKQLEKLPTPRHMRALSNGGTWRSRATGLGRCKFAFPMDSFRRHSAGICEVQVSASGWGSASSCQVSRSWLRPLTCKVTPSKCCMSSRYRLKILHCAG